MPTALSPHSPRLGPVRRLLDARGRREAGRFLIEGPTLLEEAARAAIGLHEVFATEAAAERHAALLAPLEAAGTPVFVLPDRALARLSDVTTPAGLIAVADLPRATLADVFARPGPLLLLAGVADPGNAGTLIRSAEAFGAAGTIVGAGGADPFGPKTVRAAMGSLFRLPVVTAGADAVLAEAARTSRPIVAADLAGAPLAEADLPKNGVFAVGSERHGVAAFLPRWTSAVRIEHAGPAESLNAAVAGSILLYSVAFRA